MWKFQDFCITQILCEINFVDSRSAKSAISTHFEALKFQFYEFLHFWKAKIDQTNKFRASKIAKKGSFRSSRFSKIDFT